MAERYSHVSAALESALLTEIESVSELQHPDAAGHELTDLIFQEKVRINQLLAQKQAELESRNARKICQPMHCRPRHRSSTGIIWRLKAREIPRASIKHMKPGLMRTPMFMKSSGLPSPLLIFKSDQLHFRSVMHRHHWPSANPRNADPIQRFTPLKPSSCGPLCQALHPLPHCPPSLMRRKRPRRLQKGFLQNKRSTCFDVIQGWRCLLIRQH